MHYYIGDVANVLGMTPGALYHYEKEGICTAQKEENGWRYYSPTDFIRLVSARKYRAMGISVNEIAAQFDHQGLPAVHEKLRNQLSETQQMIEHYTRIAREIAWFTEAIERIPKCLGRIDICSSSEIYMLSHGNNGLITRNKKEQKLTCKWLAELPVTRVSLTLPENFDQAHYALTLLPEYAQTLGLAEESSSVQKLVAQNCLHSIVCCNDLYNNLNEPFAPLDLYMKNHGFEKNGPAYGIILAVDHELDYLRSYVEVWMPFK